MNVMENNDRKERIQGVDPNTNQPVSEDRQEQTDPNLTELKGFTDPSKKLEPAEEANEREEEKYKNQGNE